MSDEAVQRPAGLEGVFLAHRDELARFLVAHGAGDAAEDLLQELWLRVRTGTTGPVAEPRSYLFRTANNLMIDRYRSRRQAEQRERSWSEANHAGDSARWHEPAADRVIIGRQMLAGADAVLARLGSRAETIFRRYRLDGVAQRDIAAEMGVSLSTVESDLRRAYRELVAYQRTSDEV